MDLAWGTFLLMAFIAAALLAQAMLTLWQARYGRQARRLEERLRALNTIDGADSHTPAPVLRSRRLSDHAWLDRQLRRTPWVLRADAWLAQSGLPWTLTGLAGLMLGSAALAALAAMLLGGHAATAVLAATLVAAAWPLWVQRQRQLRLQALLRELPDILDLMARAMQAGHSFSSALLLAATTGPQPIAQEFRTVFDELHYGASAEQALQHLAERVGGADMRFFVAAVLLQTETGGNLAEVLQTIARLMRERQRLQGQIRVLAAEGRLSAWILTLLPFVLASALLMINAEFIATLWKDPLGLRITAGAVVLMALGTLWMWRLVRIRV